MRHATRLLVSTIWLQALFMAGAATLLAGLLWSALPATFTALDWTLYDQWTRLRTPPPPAADLLLVVRDAGDEQQYGSDAWDRSLVAQWLTALHQAGATALGLDIPVERPSPPHLGGAAGDTLLNEAIAAIGIVAYPADSIATIDGDGGPSSAPLRASPPGRSSMRPTLDPDRLVRRAPLLQSSGTIELPTWALTVAATAWGRSVDEWDHHVGTWRTTAEREPGQAQAPTTIPLDGNDRLLIDFSGAQEQVVRTITFSELARLVAPKNTEALGTAVSGKVVLLLTQPRAYPERTVASSMDMTDPFIQARLLRTLLTHQWMYECRPVARLLLTLMLGATVAWMLLRRPGGAGLAYGIGAVMLYSVGAAGLLISIHWVLPLVMPVTTAGFVLVMAGVLGHLVAAQRTALLEQDMLRIQQDLVAVREALVYRQTEADRLEEDLESARAGWSQSVSEAGVSRRTAADLQQQMADAQQQESETRRRMEELEAQLSRLQDATLTATALGNAEQEALRRDCESHGIVTGTPAILTMFRDLKKAARALVPVLITGEPGTGKELFARAVHRLSPRAAQPFIAVNMAAISPELFESELFGHVRGSFTGALMDRKGYFELAHQGTMFLDEIGDLRLDHQSKLLRVLQDRTFYRVGASRPTTVDVRIVAATNKDLQRGVSEGWFREDLHFRLKGVVLHLPPLRERSDDIPLLVEAWLRRAAQEAHREPAALSEAALVALRRHQWPGNIRELYHCLEQAVALRDGPIIAPADLRLSADVSTSGAPPREPLLKPDPTGDLAVLQLLRRHRFDMQATAQALGWDRSTVTQRLKGLCFQALVEADGDHTKAATTLAGDPTLQRTVELKLTDYYGHLIESLRAFTGAEAALADCKRRFKNLPERHFKSVETLVRRHFQGR